MSSEQEMQQLIVAQQVELDSHRAAATKQTIDNALLEAVGTADVIPGTQGQLVELFRDKVSIVKDAAGRPVVTGPGFKPLPDFVRDTMATPEYEHFRRTGSSAASGAGGIANMSQQPKTLSEAFIMQAQHNRVAQGDPRLNPSMGIVHGNRLRGGKW
jgi:hypothetical protein